MALAPPEFTAAYQRLLAHLRALAANRVGRAWDALDRYDEADVAAFTSAAVPQVLAAQRGAVAATDGFLATVMRRAPIGLVAADLVGAAVRNGTLPEKVYERPFVNVWRALKDGADIRTAIASGRARAVSAAAMDVALSTRAAARDIGEQDERITGWERVPDDDACDFCLLASTQRYSTGDLMPLHNFCGCTVDPLVGRRGGQVVNRDLLGELKEKGVTVYDGGESRVFGNVNGTDVAAAVREHGELGPVLVDGDDHFTDDDEI